MINTKPQPLETFPKNTLAIGGAVYDARGSTLNFNGMQINVCRKQMGVGGRVCVSMEGAPTAANSASAAWPVLSAPLDQSASLTPEAAWGVGASQQFPMYNQTREIYTPDGIRRGYVTVEKNGNIIIGFDGAAAAFSSTVVIDY